MKEYVYTYNCDCGNNNKLTFGLQENINTKKELLDKISNYKCPECGTSTFLKIKEITSDETIWEKK